MTKLDELKQHLDQLRGDYKRAKGAGFDTVLAGIQEEGEEVKKQIAKIDGTGKAVVLKTLCYQCKLNPAKFNEYYCSQECQDKFYPDRTLEGKRIVTIDSIKKQLLEMAKREHIKENPQENLL